MGGGELDITAADIRTTSRLAGAYCWAETQLFEILGQWLHELDDNNVVVFVGERCTLHGLHLQAWRSRIAASPGIDADEQVAPRSADDAARYDSLRNDSSDAATRIAHYERVHAHLVAQYREHLAVVDPLIDEPTHRLLMRMLGQSAAGR